MAYVEPASNDGSNDNLDRTQTRARDSRESALFREDEPASNAGRSSEGTTVLNKPYDDVPLPEYQGQEPQEIWPKLFEDKRIAPARVRQWVLRLSDQQEHKHVISLIQSALINGQSQPWMYEVLAISMENANYPQEAVERVILSLTDFGEADFATMMMSGAYLARFHRDSAALKMYEQCTRILPERSEPYVLGMERAKATGETADIQWTVSGVLQHYWETDYKARQQAADDLANDHIRKLKRQGETEKVAEFSQAIQQAHVRDITIRVDWTGGGDIDLRVEEPGGTICSFETPDTTNGGMHLYDGCGPAKETCYEEYVCPQGRSGLYRLTLEKAWGNVVSNRAVVTITLHAGSTMSEKIERTLVLDNDTASMQFELQNGRRTAPRRGITQRANNLLSPQLSARPSNRVQPQDLTREQAQRFSEFAQGRTGGAFSVAPVVQIIPEGSSVSGNVVVSPDRRYVRMALQPVFSNVTDIFTFSYLNRGNGNNQNTQNNQ